MRSLVISGYGVTLGFRKGALILRSRRGSATYSLADIDRVVVATSGVSVTSRALRALINSGIDLVVMDSRGFPVGVLYHPYVTRTVDSRRGQYSSFTDGRAVAVVKVIAVSKILNQAGLLRRASRSFGVRLSSDVAELKAYAGEVARVSGGDVRGVRREVMAIEAAAARVYWGAYSSLLPGDLGFRGRDRDSPDPVNTSLNYGYGVLYPECWRALALAGLDPYAGFLHVDRSGKPVLAFDVIEVFRSAGVDYPLLKAFRSGWRPRVEGGLLVREERVEVLRVVGGGLSSKFRVGGVVRDLRSWVRAFATSLAAYLRGEGVLKPLVFRW